MKRVTVSVAVVLVVGDSPLYSLEAHAQSMAREMVASARVQAGKFSDVAISSTRTEYDTPLNLVVAQ